MKIDKIDIQKVAIVRTDRIGDMVLTLPMARAIRNNFPNMDISVIAHSYTEPLLKHNPYLNSYFIIDKTNNGIKEIFSKNKFDAVFFPRPVFEEVWEAKKSGIPFRIGSAYRLYSLLFNFRIKDHRQISEFHESEYNVRMVNQFFNINEKVHLIKPYVYSNLSAKVNDYLNDLDSSKPSIIIHPGSRGSAKDWSIDKFIELAKVLQLEYNVILTGSKSEMNVCQKIKFHTNEVFDLSGHFSLYELIALIDKVDLLIANSTGVLHIAAAMDIYTIGLFPNTPHIGPARWRAYSKKSVSITPKYSNESEKDNMELIDINIVIENIKNIFKK